MKPRISYFVQQVAFTLALLTPLAVLVVPEAQVEIVWISAYAWGVGIAAALWHRLTEVE